MNNNIKLVIGGMILLVAMGFFFFDKPTLVEGGAFPGSAARIGKPAHIGGNNFASTTSFTLTDQTSMAIAATSTSNACAARIITTRESDIRLSFYDGAPALSESVGHLQTASTTVVYDGEIYGCGLVRAYPFATGASTIITVTESN